MIENLKKGLEKPIPNRKTSIDYLFRSLDDDQFETVLLNLRNGNLKAEAYILWIDYEETSRFDKKKHDLRSDDWKYFDLRLPGIHRGAEHVYLIDYDSQQIHKEIALKATDVNRILGLTRQAGGQKPKMSPRLYAFLTVWYSRDIFETNPDQLFSILEDRSDLWGDTGIIDGRRGLDAIKEFLVSLKEFEEEFDDQ